MELPCEAAGTESNASENIAAYYCDAERESWIQACMQEICRLEDSVLKRVNDQISQAAQKLQCDVTRQVLAQLDDERGELLGAVARIRLDLEDKQHSLHTQLAALAETLVCDQGPMSKMATLEAAMSEMRDDILSQKEQQQVQMQRLDKLEGRSSGLGHVYDELRSELRRDLEQLCEEFEASWKRHANLPIPGDSQRQAPPDLCERVRELTATVESTRDLFQLELKQEIGRIQHDLVVELEAEAGRWNMRAVEVQAAVAKLERQVEEANNHWQGRQATEDFRMEELRSQVELVRLVVEESRCRRPTAVLEAQQQMQQQQQQPQQRPWSPMEGAAEEQQPATPKLLGLAAIASTSGIRDMPGCAGTGELGSARSGPVATVAAADQHQQHVQSQQPGTPPRRHRPALSEGVETLLMRLEAVEASNAVIYSRLEEAGITAHSPSFISGEAGAVLAEDESVGIAGTAITAGVIGPDLRCMGSSIKHCGSHVARLEASGLDPQLSVAWQQQQGQCAHHRKRLCTQAAATAEAAAAAAAATHETNSDEANLLPSMLPSKTCSTQALGEHDDAHSAISSTTAPPHYDLSFRLSGNSGAPTAEPCVQQDDTSSRKASVVALTARVPQPEGRRGSNPGFGAAVATVASQATPQARHCDARAKFVQAQLHPSVPCPLPSQTCGLRKAVNGMSIEAAAEQVAATGRTVSPQQGSSALARYLSSSVGNSRATTPRGCPPRGSLSYQPAVCKNGAGTQFWARTSHSPLGRAGTTSRMSSFSPRASTAAAHLAAYGTTASAPRTPALNGSRPTPPRRSKAAADVTVAEATFAYAHLACAAQSMQAPSSRACSLVHTPRLSSASVAPGLPVRRASSAGALVRA